MVTRNELRRYGSHKILGVVQLPIGTVHVRKLSTEDALPLIEKMQSTDRGGRKAELDLAAWCCIYGLADEEGKRLLTDGDLANVKQWPFLVLQSTALEILRLNGMTDEEDRKRKKN